MHKVKMVKAKKIRVGDYLPALDYGYVADVERDPTVIFDSRYPVDVGNENMVLITFHDSQGDENYIVCGKDMLVTVQREKQ